MNIGEIKIDEPARGGDIELRAGMGAVPLGARRADWDGSIVMRNCDGDEVLRVSSTGFYVTVDGKQTRVEDPQRVYDAFASMFLHCFSPT